MDIKSDIRERLKIFLKYKDYSQSLLAEALGTSQPTVSAILAGKRSLSKGMGGRICALFPDLNPTWLLTGEGNMLTTMESNAKMVSGVYAATPGDDASVVDVAYIPVSARASFVENLYVPGDGQMDSMPLITTAEEREHISDLNIFEVEGESMVPTLANGSLILTRRVPEGSWGSVCHCVAVVVFGEFVAVKRINGNDLDADNCLRLHSDNEAYSGMTIQRADIRAIYRALRIISQKIL